MAVDTPTSSVARSSAAMLLANEAKGILFLRGEFQLPVSNQYWEIIDS